jgi:uncharacterized protein YbbC (DUF1343 family)
MSATPRVRTGLERLLHDPNYREKLSGRRVALLANPISVDAQLRHAVDLLLAAGVNLVRLFGPEHGVRGEAQDMETVQQEVDSLTGLPCVSLYGSSEASLRPTREQLEDIDVLVIDLQDIGARYYTYVYTAAWCAQVCGQTGTQVLLCDRPNPLGGLAMEGNLVLPGYTSFVGVFSVATRHGMTYGELLRLFQRRGEVNCELEVIPMQGWERSMWYDQTGLPFVMPSPNMPTLDTATVYPGMCLLEGTNLSEGRGTTRPFELFGAPWLDAVALARRLEGRALPGCAWRTVSFKPMFREFAGELCRGLQLHVTDRDRFASLTATLALLQDVMALHPGDFAWRTEAYEFVTDRLAIDLLLGDPQVRMALADQVPVEEIVQGMAQARAPFEEDRRQVLLY